MAEWNFKNMHENLTWHNSDIPTTWANTDPAISSGTLYSFERLFTMMY